MSAPTRQGPALAGRPSPSTYDGAADTAENTTEAPAVVGSFAVLVDPSHTAVEIIEKRGHQYGVDLGHALLAPLRSIPGTHLVPTHRVTWRGRWWMATTAAKSRAFARGADARRFAARKFREGYDVSVHTCERTAWTEVPATDWLMVDAEKVAP